MTVQNGRFLPIPASPDDIPEQYRRLPGEYTTCRIFRWAAGGPGKSGAPFKLERGFLVATAAAWLYEQKPHSRPKEGLEWSARHLTLRLCRS